MEKSQIDKKIDDKFTKYSSSSIHFIRYIYKILIEITFNIKLYAINFYGNHGQ